MQLPRVDHIKLIFQNIQGEYFNGVYKAETNLVGILNVDKVLSIED